MAKGKFTLIYIIICITVVFIFSACNHKPKKYTAKQEKLYQENLVKANKGLVKMDHSEIEKYIARHHWNMKMTKSGLWYEILSNGDGKKAMPGELAQIRYQIDLMNGKTCYSSDSLGLKEFKIGQGGVESGLEEGILLLNEGSSARFIMPPHLAYGLLGDEKKIPPRSTIVYNVELLKLTDE